MTPSYHIIIAEDELSVRGLLEIVVTEMYPTATISTATHGQEALQVYERVRADLIISDYKMAVMNGLELTRTLRTRGVMIPIIIISGNPGLEEQANMAGATRFLSKLEIIKQLPQLLPTLLSPVKAKPSQPQKGIYPHDLMSQTSWLVHERPTGSYPASA